MSIISSATSLNQCWSSSNQRNLKDQLVQHNMEIQNPDDPTQANPAWEGQIVKIILNHIIDVQLMIWDIA